MHRYIVKYTHPKKKGTSAQTATFFKLDDAVFWEEYVKKTGAKNVEIHVS
jgi:hypothetical protein